MAEPTCYALWTFALPSGACADWYSGTWSALAVAVAAGSYGWSEWRSRRRRIDDEKAIARQIGVKIISLLNESHTILRHFEVKGSRSLDGNRTPSTDWNRLHPMVGLVFNESLPLTPQESNLLLTIGASDLLSELVVAIDRLRSCTLVMHEYKGKYEELRHILPPPKGTDGTGFLYTLTEGQRLQHHIHTLILNELANGMYQIIDDCFCGVKNILQPYDTVMKKYFRMQKFMTFEHTQFGEAFLQTHRHRKAVGS